MRKTDNSSTVIRSYTISIYVYPMDSYYACLEIPHKLEVYATLETLIIINGITYSVENVISPKLESYHHYTHLPVSGHLLKKPNCL